MPEPLSHLPENQKPVILFDGVCNLCNASVQFVIRHDPQSKFKFASLQSDAGKRLLQASGFPEGKLYSIIFVVRNRFYDKSRAVLEIARRLNGLWPGVYFFIIVPPFVRDFIYDWVSKNRYRWLGIRNECMVPSPDIKARFL